MLALLKSAFLHAHQASVSEFTATDATQQWLWFPAERDAGDTVYTVAIAAMKGSLRGQSQAMAGRISMATDGITLNALKTDFPFVPQPGDYFQIGPVLVDSDPATPDPSCLTYLILTVGNLEVNSHYHITAERSA